MPTHYSGTPEEERALDAFIKLTRATGSVTTRLEQSGSRGTLTESQFGVLETLHHLGPLCQGTLGSKLLKSSGNMTLVIDNLEKQGLVRRERNPEDRRQIFIHLTQAGQALIEEVFPAQLEAIVDEFSVLTADEQEQLGDLLRKLGKGRS